VAATNANDGKRALDNRGNNGFNDNYKNGTSQKSGKTNFTSEEQRANKPYNKENKPYHKNHKEIKTENTSNKERNSFRKDTKYGEKSDNKDKKPYSNTKNFRNAGYNGYNKDKDNDEDKYGRNHSGGKGQKTSDSRIKAGQKDKEKQPDKIETIRRLEKEKKALERKNQELEQKYEKPARNVKVKQRRTNNIDWTKGYANGLYGDDDEDYTEYI